MVQWLALFMRTAGGDSNSRQVHAITLGGISDVAASDQAPPTESQLPAGPVVSGGEHRSGGAGQIAAM